MDKHDKEVSKLCNEIMVTISVIGDYVKEKDCYMIFQGLLNILKLNSKIQDMHTK